MIKIKKRIFHSKATREVPIYTLEDVKSGLFKEPYVYWKELKPGSEYKWAIGDDGYIGEVEAIKSYKKNRYCKKENVHVKLSYAGNFVKDSSKMLFLDHYKKGVYGPIKPENWQNKFIRRAKIKFIAKIVARMMLAGKVDYEYIGKLYRPDHRLPEISGRKLVKTEKVKGLIMAEVDEILKQSGLDKEFVSSSAKRMIDLAISEKDLKAGAKLIEIAGKWLAMEAPKVKETNHMETGLVQQIGEAIQQAKLIKQQTIEGQLQHGTEIRPNDSQGIGHDRLREQQLQLQRTLYGAGSELSDDKVAIDRQEASEQFEDTKARQIEDSGMEQ